MPPACILSIPSLPNLHPSAFSYAVLLPLTTSVLRIRIPLTVSCILHRILPLLHKNCPMSAQQTRIECNDAAETGKRSCKLGSVDIEDYTFEGISVGGHETCVMVPKLRVAFDIGRCPQRAISQDYLFISHAHMDHIATFVDDSVSIEHAREYGHTHLSEVVALADRFQNKGILFMHFSARYSVEEIQSALQNLPQSLHSRAFGLTEGF
eukprot:c26362_g1_i2 orf=100-726(+)